MESDMLLIALMLMLYPNEGICGSCSFSGHTFYCSKVNQDEFLYEIFRQEEYLSSNYVNTIIIEDSYFETIADFPNLSDLFPNITVTDLAIRRSSIKSISDSLFNVFNQLVNLDLSENYIENVTFCADLSVSVQTVNLSHNHISIIDISKRQVVLDYLDLSYNNLTEYTESSTDRDFVGKSLDLSYNTYLTNVSLLEKNILYILGCNVQSFVDELTVQKMFTDFLPYHYLNVVDLFTISNTNLNSLSTENLNLKISCKSNHTVIDFSNTNLTTIEKDFFEYIITSDCFDLNLSFNNLSNLNNPILGSARFKKINLSFSELKYINSEVFEYYNHIAEINVTGNYLKSSVCGGGIDLNDMYSLDMSSNSLTEVKSYTFRNCINLRYINMSQCLIEYVASDSFKSLRNVESINLSNNKIIAVESDTFYNLQNLIVLDISQNNLESIKENAISNLDSLKEILFSRNHFYEIHNLTIYSGAFQDLSKLKELQLSEIGIVKIMPGAFKNLLNLNIIDLRNNDFTAIDNVFSNIKTQTLYLGKISDPVHFVSSVHITNLFLQTDYQEILEERFVVSINLKNLHILDSTILHISDNFLLGSYKLEYIHFENTTVKSAGSKVFTGLFHLLDLNASIFFNDIDVLEDNMFNDLYRLKSLHISNGKLSKIKKDAFFGLNNLQKLFLNNNQIDKLDLTLLRNLNLSLLDLSNNAFETIDILSITSSLPYLKTFNLGDCQLKNLSVSNTIVNENLETLILSNNMLTDIPYLIVESFPNLRILHINQNMLSEIRPPSNCPNITELRADGNSLIDVYELSTKNKLQLLNISDNPNLGKHVDLTYLGALPNLETYLMDNTDIRLRFDLVSNSYPSLQKVGLNYNQYQCDDLQKLLQELDERNISYVPNNPRYDIDNIEGITCSGRTITPSLT
ncbi:unnamed protein product [Diabrotica balteata]|uniref:Uncharacterized protein n=1 Tax=Diabrotica balteata TaxID=107213 RepID=A0A9P0GZL2_DIABA|nr:unnamed protein product [Diabrotica balteata]